MLNKLESERQTLHVLFHMQILDLNLYVVGIGHEPNRGSWEGNPLRKQGRWSWEAHKGGGDY